MLTVTSISQMVIMDQRGCGASLAWCIADFATSRPLVREGGAIRFLRG
jgi:hypothetical protein